MPGLSVPWNLPFTHPASLIATWFGAGLLPRLPGTWGSLAALPVAWVIGREGGPWALAVAALVLFPAGLWACHVIRAHGAAEDPPPVVVDEVTGQWLVLVMAPLDAGAYVLAFVLFRLFDIAKPWPVNLVQAWLPAPLAIMADDVAAAVLAAVAFALVAFGIAYVR